MVFTYLIFFLLDSILGIEVLERVLRDLKDLLVLESLVIWEVLVLRLGALITEELLSLVEFLLGGLLLVIAVLPFRLSEHFLLVEVLLHLLSL